LTLTLPNWTWDYLETVFEDLAQTPAEKAAVLHLVAVTREMSPFLSKLDLLREIICIGLVLLPDHDRPQSAAQLRSSSTAASGGTC
jgi:purine nucleoside permease